jgi:hypothetical protein
MNEMKIKLGFHEKLVEQKTNGKSIDSQKGNQMRLDEYSSKIPTRK